MAATGVVAPGTGGATSTLGVTLQDTVRVYSMALPPAVREKVLGKVIQLICAGEGCFARFVELKETAVNDTLRTLADAGPVAAWAQLVPQLDAVAGELESAVSTVVNEVAGVFKMGWVGPAVRFVKANQASVAVGLMAAVTLRDVVDTVANHEQRMSVLRVTAGRETLDKVDAFIASEYATMGGNVRELGQLFALEDFSRDAAERVVVLCGTILEVLGGIHEYIMGATHGVLQKAEECKEMRDDAGLQAATSVLIAALAGRKAYTETGSGFAAGARVVACAATAVLSLGVAAFKAMEAVEAHHCVHALTAAADELAMRAAEVEDVADKVEGMGEEAEDVGAAMPADTRRMFYEECMEVQAALAAGVYRGRTAAALPAPAAGKALPGAAAGVALHACARRGIGNAAGAGAGAGAAGRRP